MPDDDFERQRAAMVERQLVPRGIDDERVLAAMREVPREVFVPAELRESAYADQALPIGGGQTISQPYIIARTCQALALQGHERVLEVGTGSGYSTGVLARLAREVISIELRSGLADSARQALERLGAPNVEVLVRDGSHGLPERGPYDGIAVHALAQEDPGPFLDQLAPAGRLVVPLPGAESDVMTLFTESDGQFDRTVLDLVRFVPLVSDEAT